MEVLRALIILSIVSLGFGQVCIAPQWTTNVALFTAVGTDVIQQLGIVTFDYINQRYRVDIVDRVTNNSWTSLERYDLGLSYYMINDTCMVQKLTDSLEMACIPTEATQSTVIVGGNLACNAYHVDNGTVDDWVLTKIANVPIYFVSNDYSSLITQVYYNFDNTVDPNAFNPPSNCRSPRHSRGGTVKSPKLRPTLISFKKPVRVY